MMTAEDESQYNEKKKKVKLQLQNEVGRKMLQSKEIIKVEADSEKNEKKKKNQAQNHVLKKMNTPEEGSAKRKKNIFLKNI